MTNTLLLCGLGPTFRNKSRLRGTFLEVGETQLLRAIPQGLSANDFQQRRAGRRSPVLRPQRRPAPLLAAATLSSVLTRAGFEHEVFSLDHVWAGDREPSSRSVDVVALSTSFICTHATLLRALRWIESRFPGKPLVLGGQFSNLKADEILSIHQSVDYVVKGDGEVAFPALLHAIDGGRRLDDVPNLVARGPGSNHFWRSLNANINLDEFPAPIFTGDVYEVPYESMRGCPFSCKFCSYPAASPRWRWKSAATILRDWREYTRRNNAARITAMDSTFTVPPARFRELLSELANSHVSWTAYARADDITNSEQVQRIVGARCEGLSIGFESMSDSSLDRMNKRTCASDNRRAAELLAAAAVDLRASFIIGYPSETPCDYEETHRYLVDEFCGRFLLNTFSLVDDTLPVWQEAEAHELRVQDPEAPNHSWTHRGMDAEAAETLYEETLEAVRWNSDSAVLDLWQSQFERPLLHSRSLDDNRLAEKHLERLAFAEGDSGTDINLGERRVHDALAGLERLGVDVRRLSSVETDPPLSPRVRPRSP